MPRTADARRSKKVVIYSARAAWLQHSTLRRMSTYHNRPALIATSDATGALGGRVARRLANAGEHARSIVLDADHDADLPEMEVVEASYREPASMRRAL